MLLCRSYLAPLGLLLLGACRSAGTDAPLEPPTEPNAEGDESPRVDAALADSAATTTDNAPEVYRLGWGVATGEWNSAVAVAPAGWVVSGGSRRLSVHASDDGRQLEATQTCSIADNGVAVFSDTAGALVCSDGEIRALTFPGLASIAVADLGSRIETVGWSAGHLVAGDNKGLVTVLDVRTWKTIDSFTMAEEIESAAIAPDGSWAAAGDNSGVIVVRDLGAKTSRELAKGSSRPTAMQASPDGKHVFVENGSFEARVYDVGSGAVTDAFKAGSWLSGARWLSPDLIAATGSDGVLLYPKGAAKGERLVDPSAREYRTGEWLGASVDGSTVCAGDRDGWLSCFSTRPMPASTYEPAPIVAQADTAPADVGGAPAAAEEPSAPTVEFLGVIKSRKGKVLRVGTSGGALPAVGTKGSLSRKFERTMGRMTMSGWMGIAEVKVTAVKGDVIELKILKETANVVINGRKQKQFKSGFEVRLEPSP